MVTFNHTVSTSSGSKTIARFTDLSFSTRGVYRLTFTQPNFNLAVSTTVYVQGAHRWAISHLVTDQPSHAHAQIKGPACAPAPVSFPGRTRPCSPTTCATALGAVRSVAVAHAVRSQVRLHRCSAVLTARRTSTAHVRNAAVPFRTTYLPLRAPRCTDSAGSGASTASASLSGGLGKLNDGLSSGAGACTCAGAYGRARCAALTTVGSALRRLE